MLVRVFEPQKAIPSHQPSEPQFGVPMQVFSHRTPVGGAGDGKRGGVGGMGGDSSMLHESCDHSGGCEA